MNKTERQLDRQTDRQTDERFGVRLGVAGGEETVQNRSLATAPNKRALLSTKKVGEAFLKSPGVCFLAMHVWILWCSTTWRRCQVRTGIL